MKTTKIYKQVGMTIGLGYNGNINSLVGKEVELDSGDNEEDVLCDLSKELGIEMLNELGILLRVAAERDKKDYLNLFEWLEAELKALENVE